MAHPNDSKLSPKESQRLEVVMKMIRGHQAALARKTVTGALKDLHEAGLKKAMAKRDEIRKCAGLPLF